MYYKQLWLLQTIQEWQENKQNGLEEISIIDQEQKLEEEIGRKEK